MFLQDVKQVCDKYKNEGNRTKGFNIIELSVETWLDMKTGLFCNTCTVFVLQDVPRVRRVRFLQEAILL